MSAWPEMLDDRSIGGKEPLGMARRLEALHASLPLACRLVRVLCPIIEIPVLARFYPGEDFSLGGSIAL
jgi:hypothetical protein